MTDNDPTNGTTFHPNHPAPGAVVELYQRPERWATIQARRLALRVIR